MNLRTKAVCFMCLAFALQACYNKMGKMPSDVISPEQFTQLIVDIRMAEAHQKVLRQKGYYDRDLIDSSYQQIYALHKVSEEDVVRSYKFYIDNPEWMEKLSADAIDVLNKMEE